MPAQQKVSPEQIISALTDTHGNVEASAKRLGISRNCLYKRLIHIGLEPRDYRKGGAHCTRGGAPATKDTRGVLHEGWRAARDGTERFVHNEHAHKSEIATFPRAEHSRTVRNMHVEVDPRAPRLRESKNLYLRPEQIEAVKQARFDLQAKLRIELSDSKVLERFIDAKFDDWLNEILGGRKTEEST